MLSHGPIEERLTALESGQGRLLSSMDILIELQRSSVESQRNIATLLERSQHLGERLERHEEEEKQHWEVQAEMTAKLGEMTVAVSDLKWHWKITAWLVSSLGFILGIAASFVTEHWPRIVRVFL